VKIEIILVESVARGAVQQAVDSILSQRSKQWQTDGQSESNADAQHIHA
jgi:hypothetical protein